MENQTKVVVFVHGWSVTHTKAYGGLPRRLQVEAAAAGIGLDVREIFLGRYISFHDEVRLRDISRGFRAAVKDTLGDLLESDERFACITHSTGGPVIRDWWHRYYASASEDKVCPMSHLIMLAPANFGSALAQLGKGRIGRMKSWFEGVEPGQGVLDWLELGSTEAWDLNEAWIRHDTDLDFSNRVFPFVLTGQTIDRKLYDVLNTYTGEMGSDGVVRVAAANLNANYVRLVQRSPASGTVPKSCDLEIDAFAKAPATAMRIVSGKSHSGKRIGIMRSVKAETEDEQSRETVDRILACLSVQTTQAYDRLRQRFDIESAEVQKSERAEKTKGSLLQSPRTFIHDRCSMAIFRVRDDQGLPVQDYDLVLTAGAKSNPNHLPDGFALDRQRNRVNRETITYYFNYDVMAGCRKVIDKSGHIVREKLNGIKELGLKIDPRPESGFVHYIPGEIRASQELLEKALRPNCTTLIDVQLRRIVHEHVFRLQEMTEDTKPESFKRETPGDVIIDD
ncbi:esterase/lipase family protein [Candidatus Bipolaricaulota bacterium]